MFVSRLISQYSMVVPVVQEKGGPMPHGYVTLSDRTAKIFTVVLADEVGGICSLEDLETKVKEMVTTIVARAFDTYTGEDLEAKEKVSIHSVRVSRHFPADFGLTLESYWSYETGLARRSQEDEIVRAIAGMIKRHFGVQRVRVHIVTFEP